MFSVNVWQNQHIKKCYWRRIVSQKYSLFSPVSVFVLLSTNQSGAIDVWHTSSWSKEVVKMCVAKAKFLHRSMWRWETDMEKQLLAAEGESVLNGDWITQHFEMFVQSTVWARWVFTSLIHLFNLSVYTWMYRTQNRDHTLDCRALQDSGSSCVERLLQILLLIWVSCVKRVRC